MLITSLQVSVALIAATRYVLCRTAGFVNGGLNRKRSENGGLAVDLTFLWNAPTATRFRSAPRLVVTAGPDGPSLSLPYSVQPHTYYPLKDQPALHRRFAEVQPTLAGVTAFASEYGLLLRRLDMENFDVAEAVAVWLPRIAWMRHLTSIWDLIRPQGELPTDVEKLFRSLVRYRSDSVAEVREPDIGDGHLVPDHWLSWLGREWWSSENVVRALGALVTSGVPGDPWLAYRWPLTVYLTERISHEYGAMRQASLEYRPMEALHVRIGAQPENLWEAMVFQFAHAVSEERRYRRCAVCRSWLEFRGELGPEDRAACSPACRQRLYRQRIEQATTLHEQQGMGAEVIAERLGADINTVRGWLDAAAKRKDKRA
jgi:hypothetical protein